MMKLAQTALSLDDAWLALERLVPAPREEFISLDDADGRILAAPVHASRSSPPTAVSAMDGYAVRDPDLSGGCARLRIVGRSFAGAGFADLLGPGECARVFTGARVPENADRVIPQEDVVAEGAYARMHAANGKRHIREAGSDVSCGARIAARGDVITPQRLIAIAGADVGSVRAFARPRVSIIATGDELVEPGQAGASLDAVPDSVSVGVAALAKRWGGAIVRRVRLRDCVADARDRIDAALGDSDVLVMIGGASVGERDHAKAMFAHAALELAVDKVDIRPGKPVWFGRAAGRVIIGLPGNPTAAFVTARLFLAPLLAAMRGGRFGDGLAWTEAVAAIDIEATGARETLLRAGTTVGGVEPLREQDASAQAALASADMLVRRRADAPRIHAGALIDVLPL